MSEETHFVIHLEHLEDYAFKVKFDWEDAADVIMDEPTPLGAQQGPNAARLLAAAAANCLSASLLYCVQKQDVSATSLHTEVRGELVRNDQGRLRVGGLQVVITVNEALEDSKRLGRCLALFEDFCVVTSSLRQGVPVQVQVRRENGELLHQAG